MTLRGAININSIVTTLVGVVIIYVGFSASKWISHVELAQAQTAVDFNVISNRMSTIETQVVDNWGEIKRRLDSIEQEVKLHRRYK